MSLLATIPVQTAPAVDTRYTQDVVPVLDTSKFEHMQRIAMVMAKTSTMPNSLKFFDSECKKKFDDDVIVANCFRVVNQAVRWGMDPFAVLDCASIIHGRLMWEGKLVAAVIDAKLGVRLNYRYDEKPGQELGITVYATLPGELESREIFGRVKDWHRGAKSPWASEVAWKRQLRYMGNREWARAHAPAVMLGVYVKDELDEIAARDIPAGQRAHRMKDITPPSPTLEIPDIPDAPTVSETGDEPIADADGFLAKLADDLALCDSAEELSQIVEANADIVARLPNPQKTRAAKMYAEAAE